MDSSSLRKNDRPVPPRALRGFEHINRYWDRVHDTHAAKILPGEYYVTSHDEVIVTVLGSCVSACIRDKVFGIGGMNHFMLPEDLRKEGDGRSGLIGEAARYGNYAMEHLINDILKHGASRQHLEVKIVGGGRILANMTNIGMRNVSFVKQYIETEGLDLDGEDVGDIHPRKVMYYPRTGKVKVKKLRSLHNNTVLDREQEYMHELEDKPVAGEVELF